MKRISFTEVNETAMQIINDLKEGKIDVSTAREIRGLLNVVIDTGKTQVELLKSLPENVREQLNKDQTMAIAGTVKDKDTELDLTLKEIEYKQNNYPS